MQESWRKEASKVRRKRESEERRMQESWGNVGSW